MKKFTLLFTLLILLCNPLELLAQKIAIIGLNHNSSSPNTDGFAFVAIEALSPGDVYYFTDREYVNSTNNFPETNEGVVKFSVSSAISVGEVVFVSETGTSTDAFNVTCSGGGSCGTASVIDDANNSFSIATDGEAFYAFEATSDANANSSTPPTVIHSVFYTGESGRTPRTGGNIPSDLDPISDHPNAIIVDGFPTTSAPSSTEYKTSAGDRTNVNKTMLENPTNYLYGQSPTSLSTQSFTNLSLTGTNPVLTLSVSPSSLNENDGSSFTYTFSLGSNATSDITVNFSVGGTAIFSTDYSQSGADTYNATSGTAVISGGTNSTTVTITPTGDSDLEPNETVVLTITSGTGYDAGSPSSASGTILNDDTETITPLVAVTGLNHTDNDGFSFVALDDLSAGTVVYFTEDEFLVDDLKFSGSGSEAVFSWTVPTGGVAKGEVIVVEETSSNVFSASCNSGTCGSIVLVSGSLATATEGEGFYVYTDSDTDPTNGVDEVHAVLYTGNNSVAGGNIPAAEDPSTVYIGAVVVDGFPATSPDRTEYDPTKRNVTVDNADFLNTGNWLHAQSNQVLSTVPFSNIIISSGSVNPVATIVVAPSSVTEDSGVPLVFTFSLDSTATSNTTVNFTVGGNATFNTDYTVSGTSSYTASTGSVVIASGTSSTEVTVTPVADTDVEVLESVELALSSGTGYDGGSPNDAIGEISNDDTKDSNPLVAITGLNHTDADGFSFVAAKDIPASTTIYFTENEFDNTTLLFNSGEAVIRWVSPSVIVPAGQVIVATESSPNVLTLTRSGGSSDVGAMAVLSGSFATATGGETFYAYEDDDTDPTNGVVDIYAVLYTGTGSAGGNIPSTEDPSGIYVSALVVDGFAAGDPDRTEYDPTKRNILVDEAVFEDTSNWLHATTNQTLSDVKFDTIAIVDITPPVAVCQALDVYLDNDGVVVLDGADLDAGSTDNIGISAFTVIPDTFTCDSIGAPINVEFIVADAAGNKDTCMTTVTILDTLEPAAVCQDITVYLDELGSATIDSLAIDNGSNDNCGLAMLSLDVSSFDCSDVGANTVTMTVTDVNSNTGTCSATVTVADTILPIAVCRDLTVYLDEVGLVTIDSLAIDNGSSDYCGLASHTLDISTFNCGDVGANTVTMTVSDVNGNSSMCLSTVTVLDTTSPVAIAKDTILYLNASGVANLLADSIGYSSSDNCVVDSMHISQTAFDCSDIAGSAKSVSGEKSASPVPVGIEITLTVFDASGNSDSDKFIVSVVDTISPEVICRDTVVYLDALGDASIDTSFVHVESSDACGVYSVWLNESSFDCSNVGDNTVLLSVQDPNRNTSVCTSTVTVLDTISPTAIAKDTILYLDTNGAASLSALSVDDGSTDKCGVDSMSLSRTTFDCSDVVAGIPALIAEKSVTVPAPLGVSVDLMVFDASGNYNTDLFTVIVLDTISPLVACKDTTVYLDASGNVTIDTSFVHVSSSDACGINSISLDVNSFDCSNIGTNTVELTVEDVNGNKSYCSQNVNVWDTMAPVISCPMDTTIECDVPITPGNIGEATATDNCTGSPEITYVDMETPGACSGENKIDRWWYAEDAQGNIDSCLQLITIIDRTAPVLLCPSDTFISCTESPDPTLTGMATATDGCDGSPIITYVDSIVGACPDTTFIYRTWYAEDNCGNIDSCLQTIELADTMPPVLSCNPIEVAIGRFGEYSLSAANIDAIVNGTYDDYTAYDDLSISVMPNLFDCDDVGTVAVEVTVMDEAGNTSRCETSVTVTNNWGVLLVKPEDVIVELPSGVCETKIDYPTIFAFGPCITLEQRRGLGKDGVFPVGTTTEVWEGTNNAGGSDRIVFNVIVRSENNAPTLDSIEAAEINEDTQIDIILTGITNGGGCETGNVGLMVNGFDATLIESATIAYTAGDSSATLSIVPVANENGSTDVSVEVTDSQGAKSSRTFELTVIPVNDPPVLVQPLSDASVTALDSLDFSISKLLGVLFDDIDDSTLVYSIGFEDGLLPEWIKATDNPDVYSLLFAPLAADTGCYNIVVGATDMAGAMVTDTFELCVEQVLVGIGEVEEALFEVQLYPNPSKGLVTIDMVSEAEEVEVLVMNIAGAEVLRKVYRSSDLIRFDLSEQVSGMYLVRIKAGDKQAIKKIILDRK